MAAAKRTGRQRNQLPYCYYEGFLEKRSFKDKTSRKLWTCLCGSSLFFFNNCKENDYIEKVDLDGFISIADDGSRDRNLDAARFHLWLKDGDIKFTAPSLEARELWKGFIQSVVQLSVPSSLNLLPGQIHTLKETVEREKERVKNLPPPVVSVPAPAPASSSNLYLNLEGDMPACFYQVSRMEAELMLERQAERGNLLLRPGRDGTSFAATTRQDLNGSVFKHYRVSRKHEGGFAIDLEKPIPCATLHDVMDCLVKKTGGALTPLVMEEGPYEDSITFVQSNEESGEKSVECALPNPNLPPVPTLPPKPVLPRECIPIPVPERETGECLYLNDTLEVEKKEEEKEDVHPSSRFRLPVMKPPIPHQSSVSSDSTQSSVMKPPIPHQSSVSSDSTQSSGLERKKALMPPPTPVPRSFNPSPSPSTSSTLPSSSSSTSSTLPSTADNVDGRVRRLTVTSIPPDPLAQTISEELKLKLEKRLALQ